MRQNYPRHLVVRLMILDQVVLLPPGPTETVADAVGSVVAEPWNCAPLARSVAGQRPSRVRTSVDRHPVYKEMTKGVRWPKEIKGGRPQADYINKVISRFSLDLASSPRGNYAEEQMKTLFQAQESSAGTSSSRGGGKKIAVLIGILAILGLALWEGLATALRATSGHS